MNGMCLGDTGYKLVRWWSAGWRAAARVGGLSAAGAKEG